MSNHTPGFEDRKAVEVVAESPIMMNVDWYPEANEGSYRYSLSCEPSTLGLKFRSGNLVEARGIVLDPGLYTITGRNKGNTHKVASNICSYGKMDIMFAYTKAKGGDGDIKPLAVGAWDDISDAVTNRKIGGDRAKVVAVLLLHYKVQEWDYESARSLRSKVVKDKPILVLLRHRGWGFRRGFHQSVKDHNNAWDPYNLSNVLFTFQSKYHFEAEDQDSKDRYYPKFDFLEYKDIPKQKSEKQPAYDKRVGEIKAQALEAWKTFNTWFEKHIKEYLNKARIDPMYKGPAIPESEGSQPTTAPNEKTGDGTTTDQRGSGNTQVEKMIEDRKRQVAGQATRITEEEPPADQEDQEEQQEGGPFQEEDEGDAPW